MPRAKKMNVAANLLSNVGSRKEERVEFGDGYLRFVEPSAGFIRKMLPRIQKAERNNDSDGQYTVQCEVIKACWVDDDGNSILGEDYMEVLDSMGITAFQALQEGTNKVVPNMEGEG